MNYVTIDFDFFDFGKLDWLQCPVRFMCDLCLIKCLLDWEEEEREIKNLFCCFEGYFLSIVCFNPFGSCWIFDGWYFSFAGFCLATRHSTSNTTNTSPKRVEFVPFCGLPVQTSSGRWKKCAVDSRSLAGNLHLYRIIHATFSQTLSFK